MEIGADVLMKGTRVDGVYDADPEKVKDAQLYRELSYKEFLQRDLGVMDATAITLCQDNALPIIVFNMATAGNMLRIVSGESVGTTVTP
jgi:uridylate kinase